MDGTAPPARRAHDPNPALAAILRQADYGLVGVQPPDGIVLQLPDGSTWAVTAYRCGRPPQPRPGPLPAPPACPPARLP